MKFLLSAVGTWPVLCWVRAKNVVKVRLGIISNIMWLSTCIALCTGSVASIYKYEVWYNCLGLGLRSGYYGLILRSV